MHSAGHFTCICFLCIMVKPDLCTYVLLTKEGSVTETLSVTEPPVQAESPAITSNSNNIKVKQYILQKSRHYILQLHYMLTRVFCRTTHRKYSTPASNIFDSCSGMFINVSFVNLSLCPIFPKTLPSLLVKLSMNIEPKGLY